MSRIRALFLLISFCGALFFHDLARTDLWSAHEARAAQHAQRMIDDVWGLPRLYDGQADLQKPPAYYWMVAGIASLRDGKVDRWAVRLPAAIGGLLTVLMLYAFLARQGRPIAGMIAGIVLAGTIHFTSSARTGRIDMPLTCSITAIVLVLVSNRHQLMRIALAGLAFAVALLLKGPIGAALPLIAMLAWFGWQSLVSRDAETFTFREATVNSLRSENSTLRLTNRWDWFGIFAALLLGAAIAAPWFLWADHYTNGEFFRVFFIYHNFQRAMGDAPALAVHPWWYYGPRFAIDFLPWTPLLIAAVFIGRLDRFWNTDRTATFGLIWGLATIAVLSFAKFKRADYLLPAYPGAALFIGCILERWHQRTSMRWRQIALAGLFAVMMSTLAGWWWFHQRIEPRQQAVREQRMFAAHIRQLVPSPEPVLLFRVESHLLAYHLGRPLHTLVEWGELNERLAEPGAHYFVTRAEFVPECRQNVNVRRIEVIAKSEEFSSATPLRPVVLMRTID